MLVVISDLHFTDGTTGNSLSESSFQEFRDSLREMVIDASWRAANEHGVKRYQPIESFDIVLLGDILDLIRSTRWTDNGETIRPWRDDAIENWDILMAEKVSEITDAILLHNQDSFSRLRELTRPCNITGMAPQPVSDSDSTDAINYIKRFPILIPPADNNGQVDYQTAHVPVFAQIHYMVGNHDWMFHLQGDAYDRIREKVVEALGLSTEFDRPFPYDLEIESYPQLEKILKKHKVFLRHGDLYDEFNYHHHQNSRDVASLGDAMVIELINSFPMDVISQLKEEDIPQEFSKGLREMANVRPLKSLPAWLDNLLLMYDRAEISVSFRHQVRGSWNELVSRFLKIPFVKEQNQFGLDPIDKLKAILRFTNILPLDRAMSLIRTTEPVFSVFFRSDMIKKYAQYATEEPWFIRGDANYVVYGHTHGYAVVPLGMREGGNCEDLFYFNSGTWKNIHEESPYGKPGYRFVNFSVMTSIAFFQDDERSGRRFETWNGSLSNKYH